MATPDDAYRTDLSEMRRLIDKAASISESIAQRLSEIDRRVDSLHVDWKGKAATAHSDAHAAWAKAASDMHEALGRLVGDTDRAHTVYSTVVQTNQRMWPA